MTDVQSTSSPGSRSITIMSGRSQSVTVDPQGWISSAADCTSAISPSKSRMLISASGSVGSLTRTILRLSPFQACFWKNVCPPIPSGQRTSASARPTMKRLHERPSLGVIVGEAFLGDADVGPIDAIGMGQRHAALRAFGRGVCGHGRLTHNLTRRLIIAQALKGRLTQEAVPGPAAEIDLRDEFGPNDSGPDAPPPCVSGLANGLDRMRIASSRANSASATPEEKPVPTRPT